MRRFLRGTMPLLGPPSESGGERIAIWSPGKQMWHDPDHSLFFRRLVDMTRPVYRSIESSQPPSLRSPCNVVPV